MIDRNTSQQLCYLTEVCRRLHRAGFNVEPLGEHQLSIQRNGSPLCCITEKGSVFYFNDIVAHLTLGSDGKVVLHTKTNMEIAGEKNERDKNTEKDNIDH